VDEIVMQDKNEELFSKEFGIEMCIDKKVLLKMTDTSNVLLNVICLQKMLPVSLKIGDVVKVAKVIKADNLMKTK
jgi:hypothetical protein